MKMAMTSDRPKVGVAVFIKSVNHPGCVLLGIRKNATGVGLYAPPGGHLEFGEQIEECAIREALEETGLQLRHVKFAKTVNVYLPDHNYHYIDLVCTAEIDDDFRAEPQNLEPDKCEGWEWFDWNKFPPREQLFWPLVTIRETDFNPFQDSF